MEKIPLVKYDHPDFLKQSVSYIKEYGAFILTDFISKDNLPLLIKLAEESTKFNNLLDKNYKHGKLYTYHYKELFNIRYFLNLLIKQRNFSFLRRLNINNNIKKNCDLKNISSLLKVLKYNCFYSTHNKHSIYITYDRNHTKHSAQKPHFDWRPCLKAMIYLDDCEKSSQGGLFYLLKSHNYNSLKHGINRINGFLPGKHDGYKQFQITNFSKEKFSYSGTKAGNLLIFNTDGFHYQGKNTSSKFNRIIRIHSYLHDTKIRNGA